MVKLAALQEMFLRSLFEDNEEALLQEIRQTGDIAPEKRLQIYRNNAREILKDILKSVFPAVVALGSEEFFSYVATLFIKEHPPQSGDMNVYGEVFPAFLKGHEAIAAHPYLADVAALEWQRQRAAASPDMPPVTAEEIAAMVADGEEDVVLALHPSIRFLTSDWPVDKLWQLGMGQITPQEVDLRHGQTHIMLFRQGAGVEMWCLPSSVMTFVRGLELHTPFSAAVVAALEQDAAFLPDVHLKNLLLAGLITRVARKGQDS